MSRETATNVNILAENMHARGGTSSTTKLTLHAWVAVASLASFGEGAAQQVPRVQRLEGNPIVTPAMLSGTSGEDINGPSIIRVPDWLPNPLGRYYLYFAHHLGRYVRLAYAESLTGPWTVHEPGTLRLRQTRCDSIPRSDMVPYKHVASPDVHVDDAAHEIRMYFHCNVFLGGNADDRAQYPQVTLVATSKDGLSFEAQPEVLGNAYFRVFQWKGHYYALGMPGVFFRSNDGLTEFQKGPTLFTPNMRHSAVKVDGDKLLVFYTVAGDNPERILLSEVDLTPDWMTWEETTPLVVLEPETEWEGGGLPRVPSVRGAVLEPVRQLRDPALFEDGGQTYLLYSVAGEHGIAIARLTWSRD